MRIRIVLEGVGAAFLLYPYFLPLLLVSNLFLYHHGLPVTTMVGGLFVDMLGVALSTIAFLIGVHYLPAAIQRIFYTLYACFMLFIIVYGLAPVLVGPFPIPMHHLWRQACVLIFLSLGLLAYFISRVTQPAVRVVRLCVAASAFSGLWIVPRLIHLALIRQPTVAALHQSGPTPGNSNRRILWILFDEISYHQTFEHPLSGVSLPNFDRLRNESFSFSSLEPAGFSTDLVIPSLFLGRRIDQIRSTVHEDLWYKDGSQNRWLIYDPDATLFGLAQRNGWSSGIDGWWIPYCHILASVLDVCSSEPPTTSTMEAYGASEDKSVLANAAVLPNALIAKLAHRPLHADVHIQEYRNVMARTHALIENRQVRFVFLHLPVPHPPAIYDRQRHMLSTGGTYLDNLVLADDTLGELLQEINAMPSASQTTVIVSSDHSWRIPIWRSMEDWSGEEERASGGHFDERPVLLIHFPGQTSGRDVPSALPESLEHDIIADMLLGKMNNSEDLAAFLAQRGH